MLLERVLTSWFLQVYIANFAGCLVVSYFLAYQTEYFAHEPYLSYVQSVATLKAGTYNFGVLFLRAIPANALGEFVMSR